MDYSKRKTVIAGNWKMNKLPSETGAYIKEVIEKTKGSKCEVIACVPFVCLESAVNAAKGSHVKIGAQNLHFKDSGAYTGEVSGQMLKDIGVEYVIIGHSERRQYFGENNAQLLEKTRRALENGLKPIFCVGEVLEDRENGSYNDVVQGQVEALFDLSADDFGKLVIAYEPVWAIGTGKTATAEQAQDMHAHIRKVIADKYGKEVADNTSILYGGSCKPENAREIFSKPDVDGGLIGGAALKADSFMGIIEAFD